MIPSPRNPTVNFSLSNLINSSFCSGVVLAKTLILPILSCFSDSGKLRKSVEVITSSSLLEINPASIPTASATINESPVIIVISTFILSANWTVSSVVSFKLSTKDTNPPNTGSCPIS